MKVYLLMGSHLGEIRSCMEHLASMEEKKPVLIHVPQGLEWSLQDQESCSLSSYDPESILWILDPDLEETTFILLDPRISPITQLENLATDLRKCLIEPVKVITCVDCAAAEGSPRLRSWLEACIYYSDIVLLGNRSGASKRFVRDYQKEFERNCYPCLFAFLKGNGIPDNPLQVLEPDTRRLSQIFDLEGDIPAPLPGMVIEASCDLDLEESENDPYRAQQDEDSANAHIPDISTWIIPPV